jgi:hypothetical protein
MGNQPTSVLSGNFGNQTKSFSSRVLPYNFIKVLAHNGATMSHIFISYSHKDGMYARKLQQYLIAQGFDAWIDDRIDYGVRWPHEIETRLRGCDAFILIMSPNSRESDWVQNELNFARDLKKAVFPLLLKGDAWWHVGTMQYVDVRNGQLPPLKFIERLDEIIPRSAHDEPPDEPGEQVSLQDRLAPLLRAVSTFFAGYWKVLGATALASLLLALGYVLYSQLSSPPLRFLCLSQSQSRVCEYAVSEEDANVLALYGNAIHWMPVTDRTGVTYFTSDRDGKAEIYRLKRDGTVERVTHTPGTFKSWAPVLGANGKLYFMSNRAGKTEIYQLTRDGSALRITHTPGKYESWSPVVSLGGTMYFTSNRDGKAEIYRFINGKVERVTHTPGGHMSWSPALAFNADLYFTSNRDGKSEIYRLKRDGEIERVTFTPRNFGSWSPVVRGQNLYFTSNRSGKKEVYLLQSQVLSISSLESWTNISEMAPLY